MEQELRDVGRLTSPIQGDEMQVEWTGLRHLFSAAHSSRSQYIRNVPEMKFPLQAKKRKQKNHWKSAAPGHTDDANVGHAPLHSSATAIVFYILL